ncbi:MAG: ATP-binding protein [Myxococcota bacterium]
MPHSRNERELHPTVLERLLDVSDAPPGLPSLQAAIQGLTETLGMSCAFAAEIEPDDPGRARTLVFWQAGAFQSNFTYELAGTPCEHVYQNEICIVRSGVQAAYPKDPWLVEVGAESYLGICFANAAGATIGHLGVVHDRPIEEGIERRSLFRLFAALVGAEMKARDAENQRVAAERRMLEGHRLESLGLLAGGIAHDFNNLLVGITGNASLALLEAPLGSPVRRYLEEIDTTAARAAELAKQMLAYSGKGHFLVTEVDLNAVVEEMMQLLDVSIARTARVRFDLALNLPLVRVDVTQIRQLLMNLVLNAAEAIDKPGGTITVSTGVARLDRDTIDGAMVGRERPAGEYVSLDVSDSGRGIRPEVQQRIFDPFYTDKPHGRGLGLAAVQGIVSGHEGVLTMESEPGRGTTFRFQLPAGRRGEVADLPKPAPPRDSQGLRVLVIDDDVTVRDATARMLKHLGCVVTVAEDGPRGLEVYRARSADLDLVLLDMTMPGMSGREVFREIRAIGGRARVVLMSGYDEDEATGSFAGDELAGFLPKPFDTQALARKLEAMKSGRSDDDPDRRGFRAVR